MPRCEGRPEGPCPDNRNDNTVRGTQGDLMLCRSCDEYRFPYAYDTRSKSTRQPAITKVCAGKNDVQSGCIIPTRASEAGPSTVGRDGAESTAVSKGPSHVTVSTPTAANVISVPCACTNDVSVVCNELLMYVQFYRDRSTFDNIKKVALHFYAPTEISVAKKELIRIGGALVSSYEFTSDRRSSSQRPASEAEIDDILHLFDVMDTSGLLQKVKFAALSMDRLPNYGPEDTNMCSIVDRQTRTEAVVTDLRNKVDILCDMEKVSHSSVISDEGIDKLGQVIQQKLDSFSELVKKMSSAASSNHSSRGKQPESGSGLSLQPKIEPDRSLNIVLYGIKEVKEHNILRSNIDNVLSTLCGRSTGIADAIRLGGRYNPEKTRPVLVKLQSVWDRRIILANAHKLASIDEFKSVFVKPDQSLSERRQANLARLKIKAVKEGKSCRVTGGSLFVNDICVYSIDVGYVKRQVASTDVSPSTQ